MKLIGVRIVIRDPLQRVLRKIFIGNQTGAAEQQTSGIVPTVSSGLSRRRGTYEAVDLSLTCISLSAFHGVSKTDHLIRFLSNFFLRRPHRP